MGKRGRKTFFIKKVVSDFVFLFSYWLELQAKQSNIYQCVLLLLFQSIKTFKTF